MASIKYESDLAFDVVTNYEEFRKNGMSREETITRITEDFCEELLDFDDGIDVLIGIAIALVKKKELITSIADEVRKEIKNHRDSGDANPVFGSIEKMLDDESLYGPEKVWKVRKKYVPDWQIGDVFYHQMTCEKSKELGLYAWYIIIYKQDEFVDYQGHTRHLVMVSLCSPDKLPQNAEELKELGFLQVMRREYIAQITITSKKSEAEYGFTKYANFGKIEVPKDSKTVSPYVTMPLFGLSKKTDEIPGYEEQICDFYKCRGMGK